MADTLDFPLSRAQQGLWWDWQLAPERPTYNTASVFRVLSPLRLGPLRDAWQRVVDRHGSFRTTLVRGAGAYPVQRRHPRWEAPFEVHDVTGAGEARLSEMLRQKNDEPFDLERQNSVQLHVFRRAHDDQVVMLRFHHLFHDHGSTDTLHAELFEAYETAVRGGAHHWPELPLGFDDFVRDEAEFLRSETFEASMRYWERRLQGADGELALPTDRRRRKDEREGATVSVGIAGRRQLLAFCEAFGTSRFRALLAVYAALLHRYSGAHDIVIGTPADCRGKKFAGVAGNFINMLPFRFRIERGTTFAELVRHVDEFVREDGKHRLVPFPTLVERLWKGGGRGKTPFFRTAFVFTAAQRCPALDRSQMSEHLPWRSRIGSLELGAPPPLPQQEGAFDLGLLTWDLGEDGLALEVKYDAGLFSRDAARRVARHFERILAEAVASPHSPLRSLDLITEEEVALLGRALAPPRAGAPFEPAHRALERSAETRPQAVALRQGERELRYEEAEAWAEALAELLEEQGVGPGALVGVVLPKSPEAIAAFFAVLKCGAAFVPVDPAYPLERVRFMLDDSKARVVVTDSEHAHLAGPSTIVDIAGVESRRRRARPRRTPEPGPTSPAYVIYTSGSTGSPKGVVVPHGGVANLARALAAEWALAPGDRVLAFAPLSFDACIADIFPAFMAGATVHLGVAPLPAGGAPLAELLGRERISHVTLPPSVWLSMPDCELPDLRVGVSAGEPCPREVVARWAAGRTFFNNYGPTEVTVCATTARCATGEAPTIGRPIAGIVARVLDADLRPVPVGTVGELCLGGMGLALGYLRRPELTAERFVPDPSGHGRLYRTGDLARITASGDLEYVGREDAQVKLRGIRVELSEVEEAARGAPGVVDAAAAVCSVGSGRVLVTYVVGDGRAVQETIRGTHPAHLVPGLVIEVESLPRSPSGKVDRSRLPPPRPGSGQNEPPADEAERAVAAVWAEALGHDDFGVTDDFFSSGGDSISAVRVLHGVRLRFGRPLTPDVLMRAGTVRRLAALITTPVAPEEGSVVTLATGAGSAPPLVLVHAAGGELTAYRHLVARLEGRTLLGLRAPSTFEASASETGIHELAERYVRELVAATEARFDLFGWSLGGVIAQAVASRLGPERLRALYLVDASPAFPEHVEPREAPHERPWIVEHHARLYRAHAPVPSSAPTFVCWARDGLDGAGAWNDLCQVVDERTLPGTHYDLLRGPQLELVVRWLTGEG